MNLDDLELELRRLPGVRATGFLERDGVLLIQLQVGPGEAAPGAAFQATRIAYRHSERPVAVEVVRWRDVPRWAESTAAAPAPAPEPEAAAPEPVEPEAELVTPPVDEPAGTAPAAGTEADDAQPVDGSGVGPDGDVPAGRPVDVPGAPRWARGRAGFRRSTVGEGEAVPTTESGPAAGGPAGAVGEEPAGTEAQEEIGTLEGPDGPDGPEGLQGLEGLESSAPWVAVDEATGGRATEAAATESGAVGTGPRTDGGWVETEPVVGADSGAPAEPAAEPEGRPTTGLDAGAEGGAGRHPAEARVVPEPRVRLLAVLTFPDTDELEVHLTFDGRRSIGRADSGLGLLGSVEATIDALREFVPGLGFSASWARTLESTTGEAFLVACTVSGEEAGTRHGLAAGASAAEAAARATLHSLNRTLALRLPVAS